jgi:hypothetical protein
MTTLIDGQEVEVGRLFVNEANLVKVKLLKYDATTNEHVAWIGAPSPAVAFCSDRQGDTVITSLGPFALTEVSSANYPGWYYYVLPASVAALLDTDAYRGTIIWRRITAGSAAEVKRMKPFIVTEPGWAEAA